MAWVIDDFALIDRWDDGDLPIAIGAMVLDVHGRLLMQLRDNRENVAGAGQWALFGGHIDAGEALEHGLIRELAEELGIAFDRDEFAPFARNNNATNSGRLLVATAQRAIGAADIRLGEGAGFGFFEPSQLVSLNIAASIRPFIDAWLQSK